MSNNKSFSMASVFSSVSESFRRVPPMAVPAILDCIFASTGLSPSELFDSLLENFPKNIDDVTTKEGKLDADQCNYITSLVCAQCHILKKIGADPDALKSFIWKSFVPLINKAATLNREMLNQVFGSFIDVVTETNSWPIVEATLIPFCISSAIYSPNVLQNEELSTFEGDRCSVILDSTMKAYGFLQLPLACHVLAVMLDAVLGNRQAPQASDVVVSNGGQKAEEFTIKLIWDICNLSEQMLLQSSDHRSCAIHYLLPVIFEALLSHHSLEVSIQGQACNISRSRFLMKIWKCCKKLFSFGTLERRDAYRILSLYLCFFPHNEELGVAGMCDDGEESDIADKDLWEEIKRGLVDKESLVRKQSLHILNKALLIDGRDNASTIPKTISSEKDSNDRGITKKERWANKEAKSLGVGQICSQQEPVTNSRQQQWEAFILLYEMLEEYGSHLVDAAWNHQISLLLQDPTSTNFDSFTSGFHQNQIKMSGEIFSWISILWVRGFHHENPLVRCLIMQSFLAIDWKKHVPCLKSLPESFIIGPFIEALNDPVQHKDFGVKGVYSSKTIEGAAHFIRQYANILDAGTRVVFLQKLTSLARKKSLGRVGLISLSECIASAASIFGLDNNREGECFNGSSLSAQGDLIDSPGCKMELLDDLRFVVESSKQHFNPSYRIQVCAKALEAAASVLCTSDLAFEAVLHFISALPREATDYGGCLRGKMQNWLLGCGKKCCSGSCCSTETKFMKSLIEFPKRFTSHNHSSDASVTYDDEELEAWESEAKRWARVVFLAVKEEHHLIPILTFILNRGVNICKQKSDLEGIRVKFLILIMSLVQELQLVEEKISHCNFKYESNDEFTLSHPSDSRSYAEPTILIQKLPNLFSSLQLELVSFAAVSCSIFWSEVKSDETILPGSVKGKLGGPSQRRLPSSIATSVLLAVTSVKAVASVLSCCRQFRIPYSNNSGIEFLLMFLSKTVSSPVHHSENGAEICLAAYEALASVLQVLVLEFSSEALRFLHDESTILNQGVEGRPLLDSLVLTFHQHVNGILDAGVLVRTRRAVLLKWKWLCLESLLSIPYRAVQSGLNLVDNNSFLSEATLLQIFSDLVESLENAGECSILPMLRLVRLTLWLFCKGKSGLLVTSCNGVNAEMMWRLVHSSWILHVSCNKRRVAHIAALLSSVLHSSTFSERSMHLSEGEPGPLKWFIEKILEEGTKSPRTFRLAALHLTGMWLSHPWTIKYYVKELKLLSLYGSIAFDEDFEAELTDYDARTEVSLLAGSPDPELTEVFINTELYARVSVAVLFHKLADLAGIVGLSNDHGSRSDSVESGKLFLLELLDSVVNSNDLAKELYKKHSAIHRRKVRAWQMICILSAFVCQDIVQQVTNSLHVSLSRNNLPSVRQYLETFAISIYLKFPTLVKEQLVPILQDYTMRPQVLSSYVFIATNVILHATEAVQSSHLDQLLPPLVPQLTSHHHSLRGFTQLLVYHVLCRFFPAVENAPTANMPLEKRCFEDLRSYLEKNPDCVRLRASMEGYIHAYNPALSVTPSGIFSSRVKDHEFECVPTSLLERVLNFLNDVREDLRCSMANDLAAIKNESFKTAEDYNHMDISSDINKENFTSELPVATSLDFQKKITLSKHEKKGTDTSSSYLGSKDSYKFLNEMEGEDQLLNQLLHSRSLSLEDLRTNRQSLILVASLLDRIPNLAGLARTCEVFTASGLAIADLNVLSDKQFQLISVTAEKWVPIVEVPVNSMKLFLEKKKREGFSILGLEQTANSVPLDQFEFPKKTVLVLGREKEGIPVDIIHILDACVEIPQLGVVRSLNVHVSGAIALWEYTRQQRHH
ncbi:uncharacterized protein LOC111441850 isoform X1 [Cucurbita moschata]|uniref:tRNA (guanosine(18)-2'-O)-methyltransferase TARBP1 n=1 Tax=Cucurbita moschata TaxID=3662 RepID=A0A6J1F8L8_CUCMO|nr:uncharacterized protein LOC111441850 isoform X1 [Cucurbita moschata]XP_022934787.1 uncharacterized protein LOC111441850 isoform X1 [Cucurbita moschata]XP_022934793.1 uncharacterized protein LOC111441850 isoform X1 [Cucurbita moschata]XP_022934802.1 uncharacterized protein LOC111441850 isoform X1 [Cucurbita moschata]